MNGLTEYQKSLIADARTGFWDWECPRCRRKTRGLVAVQSDFRCEDHTNARLVLRDHLALMDQEHINRILFGECPLACGAMPPILSAMRTNLYRRSPSASEPGTVTF